MRGRAGPVPPCLVSAECADKIHQLYEESGGFGSLLSITTDSDDATWDHESLRLLMEEIAPRISHLA